MKLIIAGSRGLYRPEAVDALLGAYSWWASEVVSGCARGADKAGEAWARDHGVPVVRFPADWRRHGRKAGPMRNREMAAYADALALLWDGESVGSKHILGVAKSIGMPWIMATLAGGVMLFDSGSRSAA